MKQTLGGLFRQAVLGNGASRFAAMGMLVSRVMRSAHLPLRASDRRLIDAMYHVDRLAACRAEIRLEGAPLYFNPLRLSVSELDFLVDRIWNHDCYRLRDVAGDAPVVVDAGAHIGVFSRFAERLFPQATVVALEPDLEVFELLEQNLAVTEGALCLNQAVLDQPGMLDFFVSDKVDWRSTLLLDPDSAYSRQFRAGEMTTSYQTPVVTVDGLLAEHGIDRLDFLKITIGSFEHRALSGARESIARHRPHIAMLAYPENTAAVRGFLDEIGGYREVPCPYPSTTNIRIFQPS